MKASPPEISPKGRVTRRTFLRSGAVLTSIMAAPALSTRLQANKNSQLQIFQMQKSLMMLELYQQVV